MAKKKELDNLTLNVLAAEKAGLSYGKYMALKYEKEQVPKAKAPTPPPGWKVCPFCGKKFYATHGKMKYCSDICAANAHYKMHLDRITGERKPIPPKICATCGKEFTPVKMTAGSSIAATGADGTPRTNIPKKHTGKSKP